MTASDVERAYSERAAEYVGLLGRIEHAADEDRKYVQAWASTVAGPIADVGCGPGQWTNFLRESGVDIEGIDPVSTFIEGAKSNYPDSKYRLGSAEELKVEDHSLAGILAWYSLIHIDPRRIDETFAEFARSLKLGGSILIAYFDGAPGEPFEHAVVTAYYWSAEALAEKLDALGFKVVDVSRRKDPGVRPHGALVAVKTS